jgi:PAS domain-containing protein
MHRDGHSTKFAPAERASQATIDAQASLLANATTFQQCFDAVNEVVVILNPQRQIVFSNRRLLEMLNHPNDHNIIGLRPGEVLDCVHAREAANGCGTSEHCCECGAIEAIMTASLLGSEEASPCRLIQVGGETLDVLVRSTPIDVAGETFIILAITDALGDTRPDN